MAGLFPEGFQGYKYNLVAMDYISKLPDAYVFPNKEADNVAEVLIKKGICRFRVPLQLLLE